MKATVYMQLPPIRRTEGDTKDFMANLVEIKSVSGSYAECWQQAKALTPKPVLQFAK
jgi:hypothetical protein